VDDASADAPRGEIVIKPTGRKVRVVSTSAPAQLRAQATTPAPVLVRPALLSLTATTAPRVTRAAFEQGLDFGEQSIRLPYGYDPRENAFYGAGPVVHYPDYGFGGYSVTPWYGGFGYGSAFGSYYGGYGYGYGRPSFGHYARHGSMSLFRR
jgi:hypothetical protein